MPTIRSLRTARGWTQDQLGAAIGVSATSIYHWESGRKTPTARHLRDLARALGVSMDDVDLLDAPVSTPRGRPRKDATGGNC